MQEVFDEIRSALHTVWNRRWLALAVAWVVCILGWLAIAFIPNSYESRARIYVELEDVLSEQLDISGDGKQAITKVRQTLVSAVNLERVVRNTKLGDEVATDQEMQKAITDLTENIVVRSEQDNLFEITATVGKSNLSDAENAALAKATGLRLEAVGDFHLDVGVADLDDVDFASDEPEIAPLNHLMGDIFHKRKREVVQVYSPFGRRLV